MKSLKLAVVAISLIGVFGVGNVMAATATADVDVNAEILAACVATNVSDITFAAIDPLATTGLIDSAVQSGATPGSINVKCTAGTTVTFSAPATDSMTSTLAPGTPIVYTPVVPSGSSAPGFAGTDYAVNATIAQAQYQGANAATDYSDTFTVTVTY